MSLRRVSTKRELLALQRAFAAIIRRPLRSRDRMSPDRRAAEMISPSAQLAPQERLELYAQQYWWRVIDSLTEDFPVLRSVIGEERFRKLAVAYLVANPSRSFTLRNLGDRLPNFLRRARVVPKGMRRLCSEVAQLEWDKIELFDAAAPKPLTSSLAATTQLQLSPAVRLRKLQFPAHQIFRSEVRESTTEQSSNVRLRSHLLTGKGRARLPEAKSTWLVVHRFQGRLFFKELSKDEFALLERFTQRRSVGAALRGWKPKEISPAQLPERLSQIFGEWGALGWLTVAGRAGRSEL